jgi:hypothetical protein
MKCCINHPDKKAFSICHGCGKDYCEFCLDEGKEYYYCKNRECQKLLKKELPPDRLPENVICPNCNSRFKLSLDEMKTKKVFCSKCEALINFNFNPPKILNADKYVELVSSIYQG